MHDILYIYIYIYIYIIKPDFAIVCVKEEELIDYFTHLRYK